MDRSNVMDRGNYKLNPDLDLDLDPQKESALAADEWITSEGTFILSTGLFSISQKGLFIIRPSGLNRGPHRS
ncbi:hypothetical protein BGX23_005948, partial [Mortierella sp. AD031]